VPEEVTFSERELDIMSILWHAGSGTVAEVRERLDAELGYTSVLKVLQILEDKGHVRHEKEGRAYRYIPTVDPEEAGRTALGRVVNKIFQGSAELALARLVQDRPISPEELARMRRILDELEDGGGSP
jgi:predicted transcriptional regulator